MAKTAVTRRQLIRDFSSCLNNGIFAGTTNCGTVNLSVGALSIAAWINPATFQTSSPYIMQIAGIDNGSTTGGIIRVGTGTAGNLRKATFLLRIGAGYVDTASVIDLSAHNWQHIVGTYDGVNRAIYINGVVSTTAAQTGANIGNSTFNIGSDGLGARRFAGLIDNVRVYKRGLTAAEVLSLHYGIEPDPTSFSNHWKFDEGSGTSATDSVGSNTGTITSATYSTNVAFKPRVASTRSVVATNRTLA